MRIFALALSLLLFAGELRAGQTMAMKAYLALRQDSDLYVGEGSAEVKKFADKAAALEAARSRAKANLVESIQVRISSETTESTKSDGGKVEEKVQSQTKSSADLKLENLKFTEFMDLPETGQWTVLATLSKEDYRRQLAGKGTPIYKPKYGLRLAFISSTFLDLQRVMEAQDKAYRDGKYPLTNNSMSFGTQSNTGRADTATGFGVEFDWSGWALEFDYTGIDSLTFYIYDPATKTYDKNIGKHFEAFGCEAGYDYTPWAWKVQPFIPLRLRVEGIAMSEYHSENLNGVIGAGLRYWPNDSMSFEMCGRWVQGLTNRELTRDSGQSLNLGPDLPGAFKADRAQWQVAISWSSF